MQAPILGQHPRNSGRQMLARITVSSAKWKNRRKFSFQLAFIVVASLTSASHRPSFPHVSRYQHGVLAQHAIVGLFVLRRISKSMNLDKVRASNMSTWKKIKRWYEGKFIPYENDPNSPLVLIGGYQKRPVIVTAVSSAWLWCQRNCLTILVFASLVATIGSFLIDISTLRR
jgi:hypothetical protein